jgi:hypothetical protein
MKKINYKKNIFSSIGLLYMLAYIFEVTYTSGIGFFVALSVIFYINGGLSILKKAG